VSRPYDIHGNPVPQEILQEDVDQIIVGGDVVPPRETIKCLLDLVLPVEFIRGNGELAELAPMAAEDANSPAYRGATSALNMKGDGSLTYKTFRLEIHGLG
jgi:hypothetical protein